MTTSKDEFIIEQPSLEDGGVPPTAVTVREPLDLSTKDARDTVVTEMGNMIAVVEDAKARMLKPSVHYGFIPGTQRPSLWQPGAEIICQMFQWQTQMDRTNMYENWDSNIFSYTFKCTVSSREGALITQREATCSTMETNYKRQIDKGLSAGQFRETIMLMAQKRAYVAAVRAAGACSAIFTQDDDIVPEQKPVPVMDIADSSAKPQQASKPTVTTSGGFTFPSGKHAGKSLGDAPSDYLDWILSKESDSTFRYPEWVTAVKAFRS